MKLNISVVNDAMGQQKKNKLRQKGKTKRNNLGDLNSYSPIAVGVVCLIVMLELRDCRESGK